MSMAEPFMPAHWPVPEDRAAELDIDGDTDVCERSVPDQGVTELPALTCDPPFRTPVPGGTLSADELHADLDAPQATVVHTPESLRAS